MDEKTLEYIAELSRLELPEEEKADMLEQMQKILDYMDLLNSVDTDATEPGQSMSLSPWRILSMSPLSSS